MIRGQGPLEAVVFDLDDTLYPERQFVRGALVEAACRVLPERPEAGEVFRQVLATAGFSQVFDRGLDRLQVPRTRERIEALVEAYRGHRPRLRLYRGVPDLLRTLRERGVRLGLLTQGQVAVQWRKIEALGIEPLLDVVVVAGPEEPKPDPAPFRRIAGALGATGPGLVMVGDCPARDFPAADALGWRTIRVRLPGSFHRQDPDPDPGRVQARSIRGLRRVLEAWLARASPG